MIKVKEEITLTTIAIDESAEVVVVFSTLRSSPIVNRSGSLLMEAISPSEKGGISAFAPDELGS